MISALDSPKTAALALLNSDARLTRKVGSFLGQLVADETPMTSKQAEWLSTLLAKADLPQFEGK